MIEGFSVMKYLMIWTLCISIIGLLIECSSEGFVVLNISNVSGIREIIWIDHSCYALLISFTETTNPKRVIFVTTNKHQLSFNMFIKDRDQVYFI